MSNRIFYIAAVVLIIGVHHRAFGQWRRFDIYQTSSINDMKIAENGYFFAAPENSGLIRCKGLQYYWEAANAGLPSSNENISKIVLAGEVIIISASDGIYRTMNSGDTWEKIFSHTTSQTLTPIGFFSGKVYANNLDVGPAFPSLSVSSDLGVTWAPSDSGLPTVKVYAVAALPEILFVATDSGIYASSDSGRTWLPSNTGLKKQLRFLISLDQYLFASTGQGGTFDDMMTTYRSADNGLSWQPVDAGSYLTTTVLGTYQGLLLRGAFYGGLQSSFDYGDHWNNMGIEPWHTVQCVGVKGDTLITGEEYYSHIDGSGGLWIYKYGDSLPEDTIPQAIHTTKNAVRNFCLVQNYPNPFNPTTKINYEIGQRFHVTIKVYDMLGREMVRLVDENKPKGAYTTIFDGSPYAGGLYICRMVSGDLITSIKLLLLK